MFKLVAFLTVIAVAGAQTQVNYEIPSGQVALRRGAPTLSTQVLQVIPAPAAQSIRTQFILQAAPASPPQPIAPQILLRAAPAPAPTTEAPKAQYSYSYDVNNPETGDIKSVSETRDGDNTSGSYSLVEPDGTLRTVTYTVDGDSGFKASYKRESPARVAIPVPAPAPVAVKPAPQPIQYILVPQAAPQASPFQIIPAGGFSSGLGGNIIFLTQGLRK